MSDKNFNLELLKMKTIDMLANLIFLF